MDESILILGASARAAAQSAARAGFSPRSIDLFADADLARLCPVHRIERYPCDFYAAARRAPPSAWIYTGGLENYPRIVERIAAERPLLGNVGAPLRSVRDPVQLAKTAESVGLSLPRTLTSGDRLPRDGTWLRKSLRSSGGLRVERWTSENPAPAEVRGWYFQEHVAGQSCGAVFLAAGGNAQLLGITRQWIGGDAGLGSASGAPEFHYAGSLGPIVVPKPVQRQLQDFGNALAGSLGLVGLFGVDFILRHDETICPIEVNPRFPASVEVLERVLNFSAVGLHVAACRDGVLPAAETHSQVDRFAGKAILYASHDGVLREATLERMNEESLGAVFPAIADIPAAVGEFAAGQPIVTLLADGLSEDEVAQQLKRRLGQWRRELEID